MGIARILSSCCRKGESRFAISGSTLDKIKLCNQKNLDCFLSLVTIKMLIFIKMLSKKLWVLEKTEIRFGFSGFLLVEINLCN